MPANPNSWMTYKDKSDLDGAVQCRGRDFSEVEQQFADALEAIFAGGVHDMEKVAESLTKDGVKAPENGDVTWTVELLSTELQHMNKSLDTAYEEGGYGA